MLSPSWSLIISDELFIPVFYSIKNHAKTVIRKDTLIPKGFYYT